MWRIRRAGWSRMADRVTKVTLTLQAQQYMAGMREAARETAAVGTAAERLAQQREAFQLLGRTVFTVGGVMAAGLGVAIARFADFDSAMSNVSAVTQESAENMQLLRDAALEAGGRTVYTASEAAGAIEQLGKNGATTADVLGGGLNGALDLAAAGELDVARAAEVAAITMKQFNLEGRDIPHVADLLAAGAGKAAGDVEDLAQALSQAGLVAAQTGLSVEETTGTLAAFADAGLVGSDAGTSLRTMLLRLTPISGEAAEEMERLGISAFDTSGEFVGMERFAGILRERLSHLNTEQRNLALTQIFGQDAIRGANLLYEQGEQGIRRYIEQTNDAGYAAQVAGDRLDNLAGDLEKLGGAFDTAMIESAQSVDGPLRFLVQRATEAVDAYNELPAVLQGVAFWIGAAGTAATIGAGAFLLAVPKVAEYRAAIETLGPAAQRTARIVGVAMRGLTIVAVGSAAITVLEGVSDALRGTERSATELANSLTRGSFDKALAEAVEGTAFSWQVEQVKETLRDLDGVLDQIQRGRPSSQSSDSIDIWFDELAASVENLGDSLAGLDPAALASTLQALQDEYDLTDANILTLINSSDALRASLVEQIDAAGVLVSDQSLLAYAMGRGVVAADRNTEALNEMRGAAADAGESVSELADMLRGLADFTLSAREAEREFQSAIDDLTASLNENGRTLDINTEQGRANESALDDIAQAAHELAAARLEETGSHEQAAAAIAAGREELIKALAQFGITGAEAEAYADKLGLIPSNIYTAALMDTSSAENEMANFFRRWDGRRIRIYADGTVSFGGPMVARADGGFTDYTRTMKSFANGGWPEGIYSGGAPLYKFAEPETRWEALISGRPGRERENMGYALEALRRLSPHSAMPAVSSAPALDVDRFARTVANAVAREFRALQGEPVRIDRDSINDLARASIQERRMDTRRGEV